MAGRQNDEYQGDKYGIQPKRKPNGKGGRWAAKRVRDRRWMVYSAAKATTQSKSLAKSRQDYFRWHDDYKPVGIPKQPQNVYKAEWESWNVFLGVENTFDGFDRKFGHQYNWREFWESVKHVQSLHLSSKNAYLKLHREGGIPKDIPMAPDQLPLWKDKWIGWDGYLGKTLTTQVEAIRNVVSLMVVCNNDLYASNVLEVLVLSDGKEGLDAILEKREELTLLKTYVFEAGDGELLTVVCGMGSLQGKGLYLFSNVNMFLSEMDHTFLMYRPQ